MKSEYESPMLTWVEISQDDVLTVSVKNELEPDWN